MKVILFAFCLVNFINFSLSQSDGNPHKWDRKRRCDPLKSLLTARQKVVENRKKIAKPQ